MTANRKNEARKLPDPARAKRRRVRGAVIAVAALLLASAAVYLAMLRYFETGILRPQQSRRASPEPVIRIGAGDGRTIAADYLPAPNPKAYTILYNYGNLEELDGKLELLREFHRRGYGAIGYDYEGFGSSEGEPSLSAALRDSEAVYRYLTQTRGVAPERIIAVGFSMGSGPACRLGRRHPLGGIVLEGGLASVLQVVIPWSGWPGDLFPNSTWLAQSRVPVLILHGTKDKVIPFRNAETNYREAAGRKRLVPVSGAGHRDILKTMGSEHYFQVLSEFFPASPASR